MESRKGKRYLKYQMLGDEGKGLKTLLDRTISAKAVITVGEKCLIQNNEYLRKARASRKETSAEAENTFKPSAIKDASEDPVSDDPAATRKSLFDPRNPDSDSPSALDTEIPTKKSTKRWLNLSAAEQRVASETPDNKSKEHKTRKHDGKRRRRAAEEKIIPAAKRQKSKTIEKQDKMADASQKSKTVEKQDEMADASETLGWEIPTIIDSEDKDEEDLIENLRRQN